MNLMMWLPAENRTNVLPPPCILKPVQLWSGKQVFSLFLPRINHDAFSAQVKDEDKETFMPNDDCRVIIRDGNLIAGIIDKKTVARSEQSLIHVVINSYNIETAKEFLNQTQLVVNNWLENRGFSIGIIDCVVPDEILSNVKKAMNELGNDVEEEIERAKRGRLETLPGMTFMQTFELSVNNRLNKFLEESSKIVQEKIRKDNSLMEMLNAGSKGANSNISQIIAAVGQQNMEGKRVKFGFKDRTLPHYLKGDYGLVARGFCKHSYLKGLKPPEFIFHAMAGRTGIIDTACKTSDTGYIQRRLCKSMESHHVAYDGTVRNSLNQVVQFIYGGDGLDPTGLETQTIALATYNDEAFSREYEMSPNESTFGQDVIEATTLDDFLSSPDKDRKLEEELQRLREFRDILQTEIFINGENSVVLPFNIRRIIESSQRECNINIHSSKSDLNPIDVIDRVDELARSLIIVKGNDPISREAQENATLLIRMMLYSNLSAKQVIFKHHLNEKAFNFIIGSVRERFYRAIVSPGEMVGTIAGQSIGEPSTQMTLNTFHFAGISAHDVTLGVPRLNELMNLAKSIRTPSVTVYLNRNIETDESEAQKIRAQVESAIFKKFVSKAEIFHDPLILDSDTEPVTKLPEDRDWLELYMSTSNSDISKGLSPWVIRFELDKQSMIENEVTTKFIVEKINEKFNTEKKTAFLIPYTDAEGEKQIIRMYPTNSGNSQSQNSEMREDEQFLRETEQWMYKSLILKGIKGITRVRRAIEKKQPMLQEDHSWKKRDINVLYTEGTAFQEILAIDGVDQYKTFTNDVHQVFDVLGIEAARNSLASEMMAVMKGADASLNRRHLDLLADTMTQYGVLYPVSRHGINKTPTGTLMRASYEQTNDVFFDAASFAETDRMQDISSNVIAGKPSPAGTGIVDVLMNERLLPALSSSNAEDDPLIGPQTPVNALSPAAQFGDVRFNEGANFTTSPFSDPTLSPSPDSPMLGGMSPMSPMSPYGSSNAFSPMNTGMDAFSPMQGPLSGSNEALSPLMTRNYLTVSSPNINQVTALNQTTMTHAYSPISNVSPMSPAAMSPAISNYSPTSPIRQAESTYSPNAYGQRYNPLSPSIIPVRQNDQGGLSGYSPNQSPASPLYEPGR
jgi:DNA-directed RNA polymerase II subunit RPB1